MLRTDYLTLARQWALLPEQIKACEIMDRPGGVRSIGMHTVIHTFDWSGTAVLTPEEYAVVQRFRSIACIRSAA
jgi:hypothetical protein